MELKIFNFNLNGIRAFLKKEIHKGQSFEEYIKNNDYTIISLQEIKINKKSIHVIDQFLPEYYPYKYTTTTPNSRAGVSILSKIQPLNVTYDLNETEPIFKGRAIDLEFKDYHYISVYQINSGENLKTLNNREIWDKNFYNYIKKIKKRVIISGDFNVIENENGTWNFKQQYNKISGITQIEMDNFQKLLTLVKIVQPKKKEYTYFNYRTKSRQYNKGMTIDYFLISSGFKNPKIKVLSEITGSDHIPLTLTIEV